MEKPVLEFNFIIADLTGKEYPKPLTVFTYLRNSLPPITPPSYFIRHIWSYAVGPYYPSPPPQLSLEDNPGSWTFPG